MSSRAESFLRRLPVDDLHAGLIAGEDVRASNGRLLVPAGTILGPEHLRILHIWGIAELLVVLPGDAGAEGDEEPDEPSPPVPAGEQAGCIMAALMALCDASHPAVAMLTRLGEDVLREKLASGWMPPEQSEPEAASRPTPPICLSLDFVFARGRKLVAMPGTFARIVELLNSPMSTAVQLAEAIGTEPSLTARLLSIVNSPLYGLPGKVDSLSRGISMIGLRELSQLAIGVAVLERFRLLPENVISMRDFWENSIAVAVFSRHIARLVPGSSPERSFVAGLLHNIGLPMMCQAVPKPAALAIMQARRDGTPLRQAEERLLGWNHGDLTCRLLEEWQLPQAIVDACRGQYAPCSGEALTDAAILHLARVMAHVFGYGAGYTLTLFPLEPAHWEATGLLPAHLPMILGRAKRQVEDIMAALL